MTPAITLLGTGGPRPDTTRGATSLLIETADAAILIDAGRGVVRHEEFAFASGEMSQAQFREFLRASLSHAALLSRNGSVHYVCTDWRHIHDLVEVGQSIYGAMLNMAVWVKTNAGQGSFYRSQHELLGIFRKGDASHQNNVELGKHGRNRSNVWCYPGVNSFGAGRDDFLAIHPTVKPVGLVVDALRDCTSKGNIVLDPFLGSGTTLMAAEKIGRRAYGLEYDPRYADVTIRRWQAYTKKDAILDGDGRAFEEIARARHDPGQGGLTQPQPLTASSNSGAIEYDDAWVRLYEDERLTSRAGSRK